MVPQDILKPEFHDFQAWTLAKHPTTSQALPLHSFTWSPRACCGPGGEGRGGVGGPVPCLSPQPRLPPICKPAAPAGGWRRHSLRLTEACRDAPEEPSLGDRTNKRLPASEFLELGAALPFSGVGPPASSSLLLAFSHSCSFLLVSEGGTLLSGDLPRVGSSGYRSLWRSSPTCV